MRMLLIMNEKFSRNSDSSAIFRVIELQLMKKRVFNNFFPLINYNTQCCFFPAKTNPMNSENVRRKIFKIVNIHFGVYLDHHSPF